MVGFDINGHGVGLELRKCIRRIRFFFIVNLVQNSYYRNMIRQINYNSFLTVNFGFGFNMIHGVYIKFYYTTCPLGTTWHDIIQTNGHGADHLENWRPAKIGMFNHSCILWPKAAGGNKYAELRLRTRTYIYIRHQYLPTTNGTATLDPMFTNKQRNKETKKERNKETKKQRTKERNKQTE